MQNLIAKYLTAILSITGIYLLIAYATKTIPDFKINKDQALFLEKKQIDKLSEVPFYRPSCIAEIHFIDTKIGWYSCNESLWKTLDGGKTWSKLQELKPNDLGARYFFLNSQIGWKYYGDSLKKTADGGKNWIDVISPISKGKGYISFLMISADGKNGWLVSDVYKPFSPDVLLELSARVLSGNGKEALVGVVYSTKDGGDSWQEQAIALNAGDTVRGFESQKTGEAWLLSEQTLEHFHNGQWVTIDIQQGNCRNKIAAYTSSSGEENENTRPSMIYFYDDANGWMGLSDGAILKTSNSGKTWCKLLDGVTIQSNPKGVDYFTQLHFINLTRGLGLTRSGKILETFNGGTSWQVINSPDIFLHIFFLNEAQGWGITQKGIYQFDLSSSAK